MQRIDEVIYAIFETKSESPIEVQMYFAFRDIGIAVEQQIKIGRYRVDYLLGKTIIECDGREWHTKTSDLERDIYCADQGYRIVRVPGSSIHKNKMAVASYVVWRYAPDKLTPKIAQNISWEIDYGLTVNEFIRKGNGAYYQTLFVKRDLPSTPSVKSTA